MSTPQGKTIKVDGKDIHYVEAGKGEALMLLPDDLRAHPDSVRVGVEYDAVAPDAESTALAKRLKHGDGHGDFRLEYNRLDKTLTKRLCLPPNRDFDRPDARWLWRNVEEDDVRRAAAGLHHVTRGGYIFVVGPGTISDVEKYGAVRARNG